MTGDKPGDLGAKLEAALLHQLAQTWDELNHNHFAGRLRRPSMALHDGERQLGAWNGARRTISLSRALVLGRPWAVVREVLKHELAHQYVEEALGVTDETAHGPAFDRVCRQHGFDGSASGMPEVRGDGGGSAVLRRIARLLALASSPNQHEAEAAMSAAQRLMLRHNIEASTVAAREGYAYRQVGQPRGRVDASEHVLASLLAAHFFVEVIWVPSYDARAGRSGRVLEICGIPSNLEVAAYVYDFLHVTAERLWREHKRVQGFSGDRERRRYLLGVMMGFDDKLKNGAAECRREGLVWAGDAGLAAFLKKRYPRQSSGSGVGFQRTEAYEQGRKAGRTIVLHRGVHADVGARGRLLGPAR